jgi:hypothetical protein
VRLPWAPFARERLVLALVALAALAPMHLHTPQDASRLALTQSVLQHGSLTVDRWRPWDRSQYGGHWYTDKAPALSFYAVPAVAAVRAVDRLAGEARLRVWMGAWERWALRVLVNGPLFVLLALVVGRIAEGLEPGTGGLTAVALGLGTLLGPLAPTMFGHVGAALLAFGAFALAWRGRYALAGLAAGGAVLWEYQAAIAALVVLAYVAARGVRPLRRYVLGALPAVAALAAYDWAAFGSPFHLSYSYVANEFAGQQSQGLFGIGAPTLQGLRSVLLGGSGLELGRGLLVTSPLLVPATLGLLLLWRRGYRAEALVCAVTSAATLLYTAGYFLPYGGVSPGPRFFAPALPFLLLGLPLALRRRPLPTLALVVVSVGVMTLNALAWALNDRLRLTRLPETVWSALGAPAGAGVALVAATAAAALLVAVRGRHA